MPQPPVGSNPSRGDATVMFLEPVLPLRPVRLAAKFSRWSQGRTGVVEAVGLLDGVFKRKKHVN